MLTVLSVAYPFADVGRDAVGGAEQVVAAIDRALVAAGHRSIVVARAGSEVCGTLVPVPQAAEGEVLDAHAVGRVHAAVIGAMADVLARERVDVVHLHGVDFDRYLPPAGPPVVATLHLPPIWYAPAALRPSRPSTFLCCVSDAQWRTLPRWAAPAEVIENGVPVSSLRFRAKKAGYCLVLARLCPEKGVHEAIDAADEAGVPLVVAGDVSSWPAHRAYVETRILPRLRGRHRFVGPVGFVRKRRLLAGARAVLVPSHAPETSSLVSMEALASGTPVIAYPSGALPSIVEHGVTGFLVEDARAMAAAIGAADAIDPAACRAAAEARFSVERMAARHLELYARVASLPPRAAPAPFSITEVRGAAALEDLADEWRALVLRCPSATPFQRPEWLLAYVRAFCGPGLGAVPWAITVRRAGALVGIAPVCTRARKTTLLGDGVSDHLDVVCDAEVAPLLLRALAERTRGHDVVLDQLREGSPLLAAPSPPGVVRDALVRREVCPVLRFAGGVDPVPRAMRENVRYYRRRAERMGDVAIEDASDDRARDAVEILFALHRARWESRGEDGVLARPEVERFHRDAIPALAARGAALVHVLSIGGRAAAAALVLRDAWSAYYYIGGLDPAFAAASPGTLVVAHAIDRARADGLAELDFLRGAEPYKYRFGAVDRVSHARVVVPGDARPSVASASRATAHQRADVQPNPSRS